MTARALVVVGLLVATLAAGCARVQPPLALPALALGEPSFFPTFESHTLAPVVGGNRVDILLNGEEIFPALLDAIHAARTSITYAQYSYGDGAVARDIAAARAFYAEEGTVEVMASRYLDLIARVSRARAELERVGASG